MGNIEPASWAVGNQVVGLFCESYLKGNIVYQQDY